MLRTSLDAYVGMVKGSFAGEADKAEEAPTPKLLMLEERDVPLEKDGASLFKQPRIAQRRQLLSTLLRRDGWSWHQVYGDDMDLK
jgi:hypothetical protein